jgi:hypothetical protein
VTPCLADELEFENSIVIVNLKKFSIWGLSLKENLMRHNRLYAAMQLL